MLLDYIILGLLVFIFVILIWLIKHSNSNNKGLLHLSEFENKIGQFDSSFRDEFSRNRNELDSKLLSFSSMVDTKLSELGDSLLKSSSDMRIEVGNALKEFEKSFRLQSDKLSEILEQKIDLLNKNMSESAKDSREELKKSLDSFSTQLSNSIKEFNETQDKLKDNIGTNLNTIRDSMDKKLKDIQEDNSKKLEQMRETVDEKLVLSSADDFRLFFHGHPGEEFIGFLICSLPVADLLCREGDCYENREKKNGFSHLRCV